jgi:hypothetical protein
MSPPGGARRQRRRPIDGGGCTGFAILLLSVAARAQPVDAVSAEAQFAEGRRLMAAGRFPEAAARLESSQRLDWAAGTLLNLAECYEHTGRLASAWSAFREVAGWARAHTDVRRAEVAEARAAALEPRLPRLTVAVPAAVRRAHPALERDGTRFAEDLWDVPLPVDLGVHEVSVTVAGRTAYRTSVEVKAERETVRIDVPLSAMPATYDLQPLKRARSAPFIGAAVGAAGLLVAGAILGGAFGARAQGAWNQAQAAYGRDGACGQACIGDEARARDAATISTVSLSLAAAALVAGSAVLIAWRVRHHRDAR